MRAYVRLALVLAIVLLLPACPIGGNLRGIGTRGDQPATAPRPETSGALPRYVYACVDADDPEAPPLRTQANDRETAVDQCISELRRRRSSAPSVSCRCRLESNAQLAGRRG